MTRIRYAFRSLAKAPLLTAVVVLSLGLGIGANTAIFSMLHQVVLTSLPVERPEELAVITAPGEFKGGRSSDNESGGMDYIFSYPVFRELEKQTQAVAGLGAFRSLGANLAFRNQTIAGSVAVVSGGYFPTLGVKPLIGRTIASEDDRPGGGNAVAILGYSYWHDKLGAEPAVLNQTIHINNQPFTVVGIAPKGFQGTTIGEDPNAFVPICFKPLLTPNWNGTTRWNDYWIYLFARVKHGQTLARAQAALNGTYAGLVEQQAAKESFRRDKERERFLKSRLTLKDGRQGNSDARNDARTPLTILMVATVLVLLIAMANAANLLLARSAQRRKELAIRAAMGAGRGELMGQLLVEALLLAVAGGIAGLLFGAVTLKLLFYQLSAGGPSNLISPDFNWTVLRFALALSVATGLLFGLYPSWDAARSSLAATLKDESGQSSSTRASARLRSALVCAQVIVSAVLLIPTGLFLKSLVNLLHVDLGIRTENVIQFSLSPVLNGYKPAEVRALFERVESEIGAIPGVRNVTDSLVPLIAGDNWGSSVKIEGSQATENPNSRFSEIGAGFFSKMGVPLIAGREFTESDTAGGPKVAVVNEQFVKNFLDGRRPLGIHFALGGGVPDIEIVGVVKNSHYSEVKKAPPPVYYTPWRQDKEWDSLSFYVRSALPPGRMIPQVRRVLASIDRNLPAENLRTLDEQIRINIMSDRLVLELAAAFAILATLLAMMGLYGVMAHSVTRRTREIGIRIALGAAPVRIRSMVLREMLWILGIGLLIGVPAALLLARFTESQLYGVNAFDPWVVLAAALVLGVTAAAAGYLPARRASRVDPLSALRCD